jgi:hypothetical protein
MKQLVAAILFLAGCAESGAVDAHFAQMEPTERGLSFIALAILIHAMSQK